MSQESQREISSTTTFGISSINVLEDIVAIILATIIQNTPNYFPEYLPQESGQFTFGIALVGGILILEAIHIRRVNHLTRQIDRFESQIISVFDNLQTDGGRTDNTHQTSRWETSGGGLIGAFGGALIGAALGSFGGPIGTAVGSLVGVISWHFIERYTTPTHEDNDEREFLLESSQEELTTSDENELRESGRENVESLEEERGTEKNSQLSEIYQILGVVATNPQKQFTSSEIARVTSMETSGVEHGLHHLHALDRVDKSQNGEEETWIFKRRETEAGNVEQLSDKQQELVEQVVEAFFDAQSDAEQQTNEDVQQAEEVAEIVKQETQEAIEPAQPQYPNVAESTRAEAFWGALLKAHQDDEDFWEAVQEVYEDALEYKDKQEDTETGEEELEAIEGLGETYANRLRESGFDSMEELAEANAEDVAKATEVSEEQAEHWIERSRARK